MQYFECEHYLFPIYLVLPALCVRFIRNSVFKVTRNGPACLPAFFPCQIQNGKGGSGPTIEYAFDAESEAELKS